MKRSAIKPSTNPMKRSSSRMKSSRPKMTPIRRSAKGEECQFGLAGICNANTETTVLCHKNGAGMGMKAPDTLAAYGCSDCHDVMDGRRPRPFGLSYEAMQVLFDMAIARTQAILRRKGLMP
jgi:hypothetical protein